MHDFPITGNLLPGIKPVLEILHENPDTVTKIYYKKNLRKNDLTTIMHLCQKFGIPLISKTESDLDKFCQSHSRQISHQGIIAELNQAKIILLTTLLNETISSPIPLILALDQVQDPGNIGAISRTAWALGCSGLILPRHNSASLGPAAYRSSSGAITKLPIAIVPNLAHALDTAEEKGFYIYGTAKKPDIQTVPTIYEDIFNFNWQFPAILCLGNEAKGLRPVIAKRCSLFLSIPFARKFDSLNIAQAGAIFMGSAASQHFISHPL